MRRLPLAAIAFALLGLLTALACEGESGRMKAVAGNYVWAVETPGGGQFPWPGPDNTLTLRPDGRWTLTSAFPMDGETKTSVDSGTYHVDGAKLVTSATEANAPMEMVIRGDTLWIPAERMGPLMAPLAEAVTGVKPPEGGPRAYFLRRR